MPKRLVPKADERRRNRPPVIDENQAYSLEETCAALDASLPKVLEAIKHQRLTPMRSDDSRTRIIGAEIIRYNRERAVPQ